MVRRRSPRAADLLRTQHARWPSWAAAQALDPLCPGAFKLGGVEIRQFKVEGNSLNIEGNDSLQRIKTLSFKLLRARWCTASAAAGNA